LDLREYMRLLRRNWILIVATTLSGLLIGGAASVLTRQTYVSDVELFVAIQGSGSVQELQQGNTFGQARVQSYVKTVGSPLVLQPAIDALGLGISSAELASRVKATADLNTVLINISVVDASPVQAAAIAQAVASSLVKAVDALEKPTHGGVSPVSLSIIKPAAAPSAPATPNTRLNLLLGLLTGLALGVGTALLRSTLDSRIRSEADVRHATVAPMLGGISFDQDVSRKPLLTQTASQSPRAESFRQLRTNLQFANVSSRAKSILITSSLPGEGKSTTATNLAIALAQSGQAVCLVDADLRRPTINEHLGMDRNVGLTTALVSDADVTELLQPWGDDKLFVLASGQIPPNPSELLGSASMKRVILRLEEEFDAVIIDAPPLLPVTDAAVLSQHVGGVVLVIGSEKVKRHDLEKSLNALQMVDAELLGVVLNLLPAKGPDSYAYTYSRKEEPTTSKAATEREPRSGHAFPSLEPNRPYSGDREDEQFYADARPASVFPAESVGRRSR
jgi:capsular exopolysaccharide synthesis family protein